MSSVSKESILAAQNGDLEKLEEILELFYQFGMETVVSMGLPSYEWEDARQSGLIRVAAAIKRYDSARNMKPINYLFMALKAGINTYLRGLNFQKNKMMTGALRLDSAIDKDSTNQNTWMDIIKDPDANVFESVSNYLDFEGFYLELDQSLSPLERGVLELRYQGMQPQAICKVLNVKQKTEDNAWWRIRKKAVLLRHKVAI
ncbi:MAG: hypothetical protein K0Q77_76 [Anaerosporomusa subterranea]|nr:hypothetical protein [Anaerosporomusa subterranea]